MGDGVASDDAEALRWLQLLLPPQDADYSF
jgi:hypothetical protein